MIQIITGTIGGGKTLSCLYWGLKYIGNGGKWITNISINEDGCAKYLEKNYNWKLQEGQLVQLPKDLNCLQDHLVKGTFAKHVLCTVDEASEWYDSYADGKKMLRVMTFFRQSRKVHIDLDLITQDLSFIQKRVRLMASFIWRMVDLGAFRIPGLGIKIPPPWSWQIRQNQFDRTGKNFIRKINLQKDKMLYACYTTEEIYTYFSKSLDKKAGQVEFKGKIKRGEKMNMKWKLIAVSPWVMIIIMFIMMMSGEKSDQNLEQVKTEVSETEDKNEDAIEINDYRLFAPMSFMQSRLHDVVAVWSGDKYWDNKITPYGIVLTITPSCIILRREDGGLTMLLDGKLPEEKFAKKGVDNKSSI